MKPGGGAGGQTALSIVLIIDKHVLYGQPPCILH